MIPTHRWTKDQGLKSAALIPEVSIDWSEAVSPRTTQSPHQFADAPPASAWLQGPPTAAAASKRSNTASTAYLPLSAYTFSTGSAPNTPADAGPTTPADAESNVEPIVHQQSPSASQGPPVPFIHDAPALYAWLQPTTMQVPEAFRSAQKQFNKELRRLAKTALPPQEPQAKTNYRSEFQPALHVAATNPSWQPDHANSSCTANAREATVARILTTSTSDPRPRRHPMTSRRSVRDSKPNLASSSTPPKDVAQETLARSCTSSWFPKACQ